MHGLTAWHIQEAHTQQMVIIISLAQLLLCSRVHTQGVLGKVMTQTDVSIYISREKSCLWEYLGCAGAVSI